MRRISATKARELFSELVNQVAYAGQPITLTRHGKDLAVLVSVESYIRLGGSMRRTRNPERTVERLRERTVERTSERRPDATREETARPRSTRR